MLSATSARRLIFCKVGWVLAVGTRRQYTPDNRYPLCWTAMGTLCTGGPERGLPGRCTGPVRGQESIYLDTCWWTLSTGRNDKNQIVCILACLQLGCYWAGGFLGFCFFFWMAQSLYRPGGVATAPCSYTTSSAGIRAATSAFLLRSEGTNGSQHAVCQPLSNDSPFFLACLQASTFRTSNRIPPTSLHSNLIEIDDKLF